MLRGRKTGGRDFKPGEGGRKPGAKNKATREIKVLAQGLTLGNPKFLAKLRAQLQSGKAHPSVFITLLHYGYGKPTEHVEVKELQPIIFEQPQPEPEPTNDGTDGNRHGAITRG